jgi:hypothetical protein
MTASSRIASLGSQLNRLLTLGLAVVAPGLLALAAPARAQLTPVAGVPATAIYSVWANGDTIVAGADTAVYVSVDAGASWRRSARLVAGAAPVLAARIRNGRLYAGTYGQGVFVSDNLGTTWSAFNQGLVGGIENSQLFIDAFEVRGDSLYAATSGASVYVRSVAGPGTWHTFGGEFELNQAPEVSDLALGGTRLLAAAGGNGQVFVRDPGDLDWTVSNLDNIGPHAGLKPRSVVWTGTHWVVGTSRDVFLSVTGREPWTRSETGLGLLNTTVFTMHGGLLIAAFDTANEAVIQESENDGLTWENAETIPGAFIFKLAVCRNILYAARADGLWRRPAGTVSVPVAGKPDALRFAVAGPQPFRDQTRMSFDLPEAGNASIDVFDIAGRSAGDRIEGWWSSGPHEVTLDARNLGPGVYAARLTAGGAHAVVRLVHVR